MGAYGTTASIRTPLFRPVTSDRELLIESILDRLSTRKGTFWETPDYGLLVTDYLQSGVTPEALQRIPVEVAAEVEQDPDVESVEATASVVTTLSGARVIVNMIVTPKLGGPFPLVVSISQVSVELLTSGQV